MGANGSSLTASQVHFSGNFDMHESIPMQSIGSNDQHHSNGGYDDYYGDSGDYVGPQHGYHNGSDGDYFVNNA